MEVSVMVSIENDLPPEDFLLGDEPDADEPFVVALLDCWEMQSEVPFNPDDE